jgi:hypothetical protein
MDDGLNDYVTCNLLSPPRPANNRDEEGAVLDPTHQRLLARRDAQ